MHTASHRPPYFPATRAGPRTPSRAKPALMRFTQNSFPNRKSRRLKGWSRNMAASPWSETASMTHRQWRAQRSEEHTSELQSLMRISYAVFCLKKKKKADETMQNIHRQHTH